MAAYATSLNFEKLQLSIRLTALPSPNPTGNFLINYFLIIFLILPLWVYFSDLFHGYQIDKCRKMKLYFLVFMQILRSIMSRIKTKHGNSLPELIGDMTKSKFTFFGGLEEYYFQFSVGFKQDSVKSLGMGILYIVSRKVLKIY